MIAQKQSCKEYPRHLGTIEHLKMSGRCYQSINAFVRTTLSLSNFLVLRLWSDKPDCNPNYYLLAAPAKAGGGAK